MEHPGTRADALQLTAKLHWQRHAHASAASPAAGQRLPCCPPQQLGCRCPTLQTAERQEPAASPWALKPPPPARNSRNSVRPCHLQNRSSSACAKSSSKHCSLWRAAAPVVATACTPHMPACAPAAWTARGEPRPQTRRVHHWWQMAAPPERASAGGTAAAQCPSGQGRAPPGVGKLAGLQVNNVSAAVPRLSSSTPRFSNNGTMHHCTALHCSALHLLSHAGPHTFLEQLQLPLQQVPQLPRRCLAVAALHACNHPASPCWQA